MPIQLACECGKKLNVKDELDGKKIKCPDCGSSLTVGEDSDSSTKSARKNGAKTNGAKSNMLLFILLGGGVLLLGFCCLSTSGVGVWWFWLRGPSSSSLETKIVGKWVSDVDLPKKATGNPQDLMKLAMMGFIEFKADQTVIDATPMTPIAMGKWKTVSQSGDVITVTLSQGGMTKNLDIKVVSNDLIKITPADSKTEFTFKRAS